MQLHDDHLGNRSMDEMQWDGRTALIPLTDKGTGNMIEPQQPGELSAKPELPVCPRGVVMGPGWPPVIELPDEWEANRYAKVQERLFRLENPPAKPSAILSIGRHVISTPGNLTVISAKAKDGKTAVAAAVMAAALKPNASTNNLLGFSSSGADSRAVIHIDTEQSRYDHYQVGKRVLRRAELETCPDNFKSIFTTDLEPYERLNLLEAALKMATEMHGGVHSVVIDGVADLIEDPNDGKTSFALVGRLHQLAIQFDCAIVCVLHENPGSDFGKTRGHLGSHLERKAETNLRLSKAEGRTTIWVERGRHCFIPKEEGTRFQWSDLKGMHVLVETIKDEKKAKRLEELQECAEKVFEGQNQGLTWQATIKRIEETAGLANSGARKKLKVLMDEQILSKDAIGNYVRVMN